MKSELFVRYSPMDPRNKGINLPKLMAEAGCVEVCTGMESGSDRILKEIVKKNTTTELNYKARLLAAEYGIRFKAFSMIGHPSETREDALATLNWFLRAKPDEFDITIHQPYPGAPAYDNKEEYEKKGIFYFDKVDYSQEVAFYKGAPGEYKSLVRTNALSEEEIVELREHIETEARKQLGLPQITREIAFQRNYDHSMGQGVTIGKIG